MPEYVVTFRRRRRRRRLQLWATSLDAALDCVEAPGDCVVSDIVLCPPTRPGRGACIGVSTLASQFDALEFMQASGIRIESCVESLAARLPAGHSRRVWSDVFQRIRASGSFSSALENHPEVFNSTMRGIVSAAESCGRLPQGIRQLAAYSRQLSEIRSQVRRGVVYPSLLAVLAGVVFVLLGAFTLPRYQGMLNGMGVVRYNPVTAICFRMSGWVRDPRIALCAGGAVGAAVAVAVWSRGIRAKVVDAACALPMARGAVEAVSMARMCVTFVCLSEAGFKAVDALEACEVAAGPERYRRAVRESVDRIRRNVPFGDALAQVKAFPRELVLAVRSGEGNLCSVMARLGERYAAEAKGRIELTLRLVEPVLLGVVVCGVFTATLAVILPMVQILDSIRS